VILKGSGLGESGTYYAMHLVEAAYGVEFPAVFKRIPRPERR
jgi:hypothetical protein